MPTGDPMASNQTDSHSQRRGPSDLSRRPEHDHWIAAGHAADFPGKATLRKPSRSFDNIVLTSR